MSASIKVCDKTSGTLLRYSLSNVQLTDSVAGVKALVTQRSGSKGLKFDLIYCGQCLKEEQVISSYGIKDGVTLYALPSTQQQAPEAAKLSVTEVVSAVQSALTHPAYRNTVDRVLSNPKTMEELMTSVPALATDPIAKAMLQTPELLSVLADPTHVPKILEEHPCVGSAAVKLAEAIKKEISASGGAGRRATARSNFSLDQMSDDEDMPGPARQPVVNMPITGNQLAAALAAANAGQQRAGGSSTPAAATAAAPPGDINDFFRQALQAASSNSPASASATPPATSSAVTEANLQSLRDMGITDEAVARRALEATNGNLAAAVDLIFGDGQ